MCWAAASMGLQIVGAVAQQKSLEDGVRAQQETAKQQAENAIRSMNYAFQGYEVERMDAFDQAVKEIEKTRLNAMQLNSSVEAAVNEDYAGGGRTADLINRAAKGDELRAVNSVKDNYDRKSNEIDLNKETTLINTKAQVAGIKPPSMPSRLGMLLNIGTSIANYGTAMENAKVDKAIKTNTGLPKPTVKG